MSPLLKNTVAICMSVLLSNLPAIAPTEVLAAPQMVPTSVLVSELSREQSEIKVLEFLSRDEVKDQLVARGLAPAEVSARVAALSDQELQQLTNQMNEARYGGDILVTILLVVLIIFLIKRI